MKHTQSVSKSSKAHGSGTPWNSYCAKHRFVHKKAVLSKDAALRRAYDACGTRKTVD